MHKLANINIVFFKSHICKILVISSSNGVCTQNPVTDVKLMYSFSAESRRSDRVVHDGYHMTDCSVVQSKCIVAQFDLRPL